MTITWGWGADKVDLGFKGWHCHKCGSKKDGRLFFADVQLCASCARSSYTPLAVDGAEPAATWDEGSLFASPAAEVRDERAL